jgi:GntR family transcriptional regulator
MSKVDRHNPTPLYEQIKLILREQITHGELKPGVLLPTENELCERYDVSRITVVKALTDLAHEGFIYRIRGKGSIVNTLPIKHAMDNILGFTESMRRNGLEPHSVVTEIRTVEGDLELRRLFQLPLSYSATFTRFKRRMFVNDMPAVLFTIYVKAEVGERMQEYPLDNTSFYQLYEKILGRRVTRNETSLTPILANPETVELLGVNPGTPHFSFQGLSFLEGDVPVELSRGIFRGDLFQFESTIYRIREEVANQEQNLRVRDPSWFRVEQDKEEIIS